MFGELGGFQSVAGASVFLYGCDGQEHVAFSFCGTLVRERRNVTGPTLPESWWAVEFCTAPRREEVIAHDDETIDHGTCGSWQQQVVDRSSFWRVF